jgi:hypothetical protein
MDREKRRGYPLRVWRRRDRRTDVRRESVARQDPLPEPEVEVYADYHDAYDWQSVQRRYSDWGCVAPSPPERKG